MGETHLIQPLVSIIIPTYNRAALLMQTLDSIRSQTYTNWELIIVDDGSVDDTAERVNNLCDTRIRYVKTSRTAIGGKLKNMGMQLVSGSLIAFNDSDDLWDPRKLEKQVKALEQNAGAGFCLCGGYTFRNEDEPLQYFYRNKRGARTGNIFTAIFNAEVVCYTQALLMRRSCLDKAGWFKENRTFTDTEFIMSLARHFEAVILYEPLFFRRLHDANYIHDAWEKSCLDGIAIIRSYQKELPDAVASKAIFKAYVQLGEKYLQRRRRTEALLCFSKAWHRRPFSITAWRKMVKGIVYRLHFK